MPNTSVPFLYSILDIPKEIDLDIERFLLIPILSRGFSSGRNMCVGRRTSAP